MGASNGSEGVACAVRHNGHEQGVTVMNDVHRDDGNNARVEAVAAGQVASVVVVPVQGFDGPVAGGGSAGDMEGIVTYKAGLQAPPPVEAERRRRHRSRHILYAEQVDMGEAMPWSHTSGVSDLDPLEATKASAKSLTASTDFEYGRIMVAAAANLLTSSKFMEGIHARKEGPIPAGLSWHRASNRARHPPYGNGSGVTCDLYRHAGTAVDAQDNGNGIPANTGDRDCYRYRNGIDRLRRRRQRQATTATPTATATARASWCRGTLTIDR
eukprot:g7531.t1